MPKSLSQYRVFIATPGGLADERKSFRKTLEEYTASDAEPLGITFHPVGREETLGGVGRPQKLINEDLRQCDDAIFIWHNRWGSPTGVRDLVGTEEEWNLAEELYKDGQVRDIVVFFKRVDPSQLRDPGAELQRVLAHKKRSEEEKRYLFKPYNRPKEFPGILRSHLAQWLRDHEKRRSGTGHDNLVTPTIASGMVSSATAEARLPSYQYWIKEAGMLLTTEPAEMGGYSDALYCAKKALGQLLPKNGLRRQICWAFVNLA